MSKKKNVSEAVSQKLDQNSTLTNVGLLNGLAGESLYYFYRSHLLDEEVSYEKAVAKLHQVIESISNDASHTTFYNGIAGVGWMISHLNEANIVEIEIEDFLDTSIDLFLYQDMIKHLNTGIYDFFFGASGICYYFISRYTTTKNTALKETYKNYITHFLFYLEYIGVQDANGMYWKHSYYPFEDDGIDYQLSSETNISAVIMILVEIVSLANFDPISIPLLQKSSNWLIHNLETSKQARIDQAFCLWKAGSALKDDMLEEKAFQLLKNITINFSIENSISLFKYALIFQKIAEHTNNDFFRRKTKECYDKASMNFSEETILDTSIWKGSAGVGLTDFTVTEKLNMDWAKCMLI